MAAYPIRPKPISKGAGPLPASGWEDAGSEFNQRHAFVAIVGPTSSGRTTLALTAKGPTALLHASEKIGGIVEPHVKKGKLVRKFDFGFTATKNEQETAERARGVWAKFESLYLDALNGWAGSVIIDTETDAWALRRFAKFGSLTPKGDLRDLYNSVNFDWRQLLRNAYANQSRSCNVITTHTCSDEYKDVMKSTPQGMKKSSERTGESKRDGHKGVAYWSDVILWTGKDLATGDYTVKIQKGWWRGEVEGMELNSEMLEALGYSKHPVTKSHLHLPAIMAFITETDEKEWM